MPYIIAEEGTGRTFRAGFNNRIFRKAGFAERKLAALQEQDKQWRKFKVVDMRDFISGTITLVQTENLLTGEMMQIPAAFKNTARDPGTPEYWEVTHGIRQGDEIPEQAGRRRRVQNVAQEQEVRAPRMPQVPEKKPRRPRRSSEEIQREREARLAEGPKRRGRKPKEREPEVAN